MKISRIAAALAGALAIAVAGAASATTFTIHGFGDSSTTSTGYQANVSFTDAGYGGVAINPSAGFTLGDLSQFSFDYNMLQGDAASGTPRIFLYCTGTAACDGDQAAFVYTLQSANVKQGDSGNTGNIVASSEVDAAPNGLGFGNCAGGTGNETFADFVTCAGADTQINQFGIILDLSNNQAQSLALSNITVNGQNLTATTTAVSEPGEIGLMGLGLLLTGGLAWRGRKKEDELS